ncbi:LPXTG cell wall anchor domain-containing protein [Streptomyces piniterrae]|uniref:LPXTG cell wall anchor domain-containing protein n=1 Tax=Streptomyces piniterrae TaxID=2571125 RepID=A0A4V6WHD4_9ACTN|nr:lytic polysaccharide monooxygenase [Streptomyces piniterrae]TJZ43468.1 LPXTG cell wall anchor domain-containing protein [Streptomyces piniterrae]
MTARRKATGIALVGIAPLALTALAASPAAAHGSMTDPVSRVSACYAEGPESPRSAACKAAVQVGGAQALYDWNGVRDGNAGGQSKTRIPDGKLCSANSPEYKGLDLPRADWPSSKLAAGKHTFRYKATAPHKGSFELYITKDSYDPTKPLKWSDLESKPFAKVVDPKLTNGDYVFDGKVPAKSGRHLIYSIWQRSDSPEAFYTCSDVVFGKDNGGSGSGSSAGSAAAPAPAPSASAPTDTQIAAGAGKSSIGTGHHDHGATNHGATGHTDAAQAAGADDPALGGGHDAGGPHPDGAAKPVDGQRLAETGGDSSTGPIAIAGAAVLAVGAAFLFTTARRKAARHRG